MLFFIHVTGNRLTAQCISSFPYNEGFETSPSWTSGGINSDWACGSPSHFFINTAGGGTKSWCVGGLTGSAYFGSAQSYLMSPCFDFSSLNYPWISFKIFWETEWKFDGMVFQYSLDGGASWNNVGAFGDPENCLNENWYNRETVSWLTSASPKHGWSGRIGLTSGSCQGGNGSGGWVTAKHCMTALAGQSNVRFRFLFGSGTTCNDFDGIAIDDILIQDAPPNTADFTSNCTGANTVSFTNLSDNCSTGYTWNFGDPASGASNTSTLENPTHVFSGPGNYTVTLTSAGPCNAPGVFTQTVSILSANVSGTNVVCHGDGNGSATTTVTGGTGGYTYSWNTSPVQTSATATNLSPGTYTVNVSSSGTCATSASVTITEPDSININITTSASCPDVCNGNVSATATGGTGALNYNWSTLGTGSTFHAVCVGAYTVTVTDVTGCSAQRVVVVDAFAPPALTCNNVLICTGSSGILSASGAVTYTWFPASGLSAATGATVVASPVVTSTYMLTGTSAEGCNSSMDVLVTVDPTYAPIAGFNYQPFTPDVFNPEVQFTNTSEDGVQYDWYFDVMGTSHETNPGFIFPSDSAGHYQVCLVAINAVGCSDTLCQEVTVTGTPTVYAPNAFTPNGDGLNELFFPVMHDVDHQDLDWMVFNRWGQVIFEARDLNKTWDGTHQGIRCKEDVYVWKIRYMEKGTGIHREKTGQVTLLR